MPSNRTHGNIERAEPSSGPAHRKKPLPLGKPSLGTSFNESTFEYHAALLGDSRLSLPANASQRATIALQLQSDYGNRYVQRLVKHISPNRAEAVQADPLVGPAGYKYKQEADRVVEQAIGTSSFPSGEASQRQAPEEVGMRQAKRGAIQRTITSGWELTPEASASYNADDEIKITIIEGKPWATVTVNDGDPKNYWSERAFRAHFHRIAKSQYEEMTAAAMGNADQVVKRIGTLLSRLEWPDGTPPTIEQVHDPNFTTSAFYDIKQHTVKVNPKSAVSEAVLWDNVLFEVCNALQKTKYEEATELTSAGSEATPSEYGVEYAGVEYEAFKKYVDFIKSLDIDPAQLPDQARKALEREAGYAGMPKAAAKSAFADAPHDKDATTGRGALSSSDLYAYQAVEKWNDLKYLRSRVITILKNSGLSSNAGGQKEKDYNRVNALLRDGSKWPGEADKATRPRVYGNLIDEVIREAQDTEIDVDSVRKLHLSGKARQLADSTKP